MHQITLRDIPEEIERVVRSEAGERGISLNKAFLSVLTRGARQTLTTAERVKMPKEDRFSRFNGLWSAEESADFEVALAEQRTVDNELWQ